MSHVGVSRMMDCCKLLTDMRPLMEEVLSLEAQLSEVRKFMRVALLCKTILSEVFQCFMMKDV